MDATQSIKSEAGELLIRAVAVLEKLPATEFAHSRLAALCGVALAAAAKECPAVAESLRSHGPALFDRNEAQALGDLIATAVDYHQELLKSPFSSDRDALGDAATNAIVERCGRFLETRSR